MRRTVGPAPMMVLLLLPMLAGCFVSDPGSHEPLVDDSGRLVGKQVRLVQVATDLDDPVFATHAGDGSGRLFVVEQAGVVRVVRDDALLGTPYVDVRDRVGSGGERGLLGLAFHPGYPEVDRVFLSYTDKAGDSVLSEFASAEGDRSQLDPDSEVVLLQVAQPYGNHNGGMIAFGSDKHLYYGLGDGGAGGDPHGNGQDTTTRLGSILRLDVGGDGAGAGSRGTYTVPDDNPFVGREGADEIWAYGLRNPWRFSFDSETGDLWIGDVGQNTREEVSMLAPGQAGANLGWNGLEGTHVHDRGVHDRLPEDTVLPVAEYTRGAPHCSVTGGYVYRGEDVPALGGTYLFGDHCSGWVWGLVEGEDGYEMGRLFESGRRISSFGEDEAGELYLVDHAGSVLRFIANGT